MERVDGFLARRLPESSRVTCPHGPPIPVASPSSRLVRELFLFEVARRACFRMPASAGAVARMLAVRGYAARTEETGCGWVVPPGGVQAPRRPGGTVDRSGDGPARRGDRVRPRLGLSVSQLWFRICGRAGVGDPRHPPFAYLLRSHPHNLIDDPRPQVPLGMSSHAATPAQVLHETSLVW